MMNELILDQIKCLYNSKHTHLKHPYTSVFSISHIVIRNGWTHFHHRKTQHMLFELLYPFLGVCPCEQLYLYATAVLADKQGAVLGKFIRGAQLHNGRSYYWKTFQEKTFFLQYQSNGKLFGTKFVLLI